MKMQKLPRQAEAFAFSNYKPNFAITRVRFRVGGRRSTPARDSEEWH